MTTQVPEQGARVCCHEAILVVVVIFFSAMAATKSVPFWSVHSLPCTGAQLLVTITFLLGALRVFSEGVQLAILGTGVACVRQRARP